MDHGIDLPEDLAAADALAASTMITGRSTAVEGAPILRVLPTKGRRTVGAWCFVDLSGTDSGAEQDPMEVGPHPHTGLATVTWLLEGMAMHTDSLGTEQLIRPGQLNLMHAGRGIAHAERGGRDRFRGAQMWIAQPEATRHGRSAFEHHGELPRTLVGADGEAIVFMGQLADATSPARIDTDIVGADITLQPGLTQIPVNAHHEHAVIPLDRPVLVAGLVVEVGALVVVPPGTSVIPVEARDLPSQVLLLGGKPMTEKIQMWWNFVARTQDELTAAWRAWAEHDHNRYGPVTSIMRRIDAPVPPWIRGV